MPGVSEAGGIESNELLVVAMLRDELSAGMLGISGALDKVAASNERLAATSKTSSTRLTEQGVAAEATGRKLTAAELAAGRFGHTIGGVGVGVGRTAAGMAIAAAGSLYLAAKFDASMTRIQTQAGASAAEVARLRGEVLSLAGQTGQSPEHLADGLYHIESAGFRGAQALSTLHAAAMLASVGNANLEDTTQAMIASVASGIKGVDGAIGAAALLNKTVGIGDMRMQQLAAALATGILPSARSAGLSFQDVAAALATITDNASPANEAATRLRMTFALLSTQTPTAAKALAEVGIGADRLGNDMRKHNGLLVALEDLQAHLEQSGLSATKQHQVLERAFGGGRTSAALLTLLEEMDRLRTKYAELGTSEQQELEFQAAWAAHTQTLAYKWHSLSAALQADAIVLGHDLTPAAKDLLDILTGTLHVIGSTAGALNSHRTAIIAVAVAITALMLPALYRMAAAAATTTLLTLRANLFGAGAAAISLGSSIGPIGFGLGALAAVGVGLWAMNRRGAQQAKQAVIDYANSVKSSTTDIATEERRLSMLQDHYAGILNLHHALEQSGNHLLAGSMAPQYGTAVAQIQATRAALGQMRANVAQLSPELGLSTQQVQQLAAANGIDLTGSYKDVSRALSEVQAQAQMSRNANQQATSDIDAMASSSTSAADAVNHLSNALSRLAGNHIAVHQARIQLINDERALTKALHASGGSMSLSTVKGTAAASAFDQMANSVIALTNAAATASGASLPKTAAALQHGINMLAPFAKGNNAAAREVNELERALQKLQDKIDGMHGKTVNVAVNTFRSGGAGGHLLDPPGGDTATPRAVAGGNVFAFHAAMAGRLGGKRSISSGVRHHNLGSPWSDHATGRAIDVVGDGLLGYQAAARGAGGFAEFHGAGAGRHLHVAMGDTATPRASSSSGGGGPVIDVGGIQVVVGDIGHMTHAEVAELVEVGVRKGVRAAVERSQVPAETFGAH